jgi:hypothetical protein
LFYTPDAIEADDAQVDRRKMSIITKIVQSETPEDVILFATRSESGISYPRLDGLYSRNGWVNIGNNLELMKLVHNMALEGLVVYRRG